MGRAHSSAKGWTLGSQGAGMAAPNWLYLLHTILKENVNSQKRQRRYLLFTPSTQWGVFVTVSIPLPHPETLVSVAWFIEANYYNVDNATYFEPLLGDIGDVPTVRRERSTKERNSMITRHTIYTSIETMLDRHNYLGRQCLLRAICESASQFLHNGVLGDLLHLVLTPSTSMPEEEIEDIYYEAEYWGLEDECEDYVDWCPENPIDYISISLE
ncbi:jg27895 [Pararge aegeria aegeria]|uniref:Jg27895 protein n=1 Tax=Pararge aegeria aegeria TaxID=348720 RepID=A0A8S4SEI6_9NEOP|nr:jg27895 [Pararge aegeria aegeria]